jgi:hypothetical protein
MFGGEHQEDVTRHRTGGRIYADLGPSVLASW